MKQVRYALPDALTTLTRVERSRHLHAARAVHAKTRTCHIDVIVVPPTDERPFYRLITMGMGAYKMKAPRGARGL